MQTSVIAIHIVRLSGVDGAVILDRNGYCHAFGVILDGLAAAGQGDSARGSRYNSAILYQRTRAPRSLIVVISDDGTVDLIPHLKPRVDRQEFEAAVNDFLAICDADPVSGEAFARTHERLRDFAFYLNEEQCQRVNEALEKEVRRRSESGMPVAYYPPLQPHSELNDSYFY